jgi:hypothetical protein
LGGGVPKGNKPLHGVALLVHLPEASPTPGETVLF